MTQFDLDVEKWVKTNWPLLAVSGVALLFLFIGITFAFASQERSDISASKVLPTTQPTPSLKDSVDEQIRDYSINASTNSVTVATDGAIDIQFYAETPMRALVEKSMTKAYKYLYTNQHPPSVKISCVTYVVDQYGNKSEKVVYATHLDQDVASKVNWAADDPTLRSILPGLWSVDSIDPSNVPNG